METQENQFWGMNENSFISLMHVSQFAGFIIPFAGYALPVMMWISNKDKNENIDENGKNIINWLISSTIYAIISAILIFVVIGIALLIVLLALCIIFPIIGASKSNNNEIWKYPLAISFIK